MPSFTPTPKDQPDVPTPEPFNSPNRLMETSLQSDGYIDLGTVGLIGKTGNLAFVPVLIELFAFPNFFDVAGWTQVTVALEQITGNRWHVREWLDAAEWLRQHPEIEPPSRFDKWKGRLFSLIHKPIGEFLYEGVPRRIRLEQIVWGGVAKDGIPDLINPPHVSAGQATYLRDDDRVFGVTINGQHRAYPLRIMNAHEMANDELGGEPIALAYCTLCGTAIVYSTNLKELSQEPVQFGTSGLLYRSNKLMYDRVTNTLWNQFTGEPAVGPLVESDIRLKQFPITLTTWEDWRTAHRDTTVLGIDTGVYPPTSYLPEDNPNAIYFDYFNSPNPIFPIGERSDLLSEKDVVLGLAVDGRAKAYPLDTLKNEPVLNDSVASANVVVITNPDAGSVRVFDRGEHLFSRPDFEALTIADEQGNAWQITEDALVNQGSGEQLGRMPGSLGFWFAWFQFHPLTDVYGLEQDSDG